MIDLKGDEYNKLLPARPIHSHKGVFGTLGAVVGSLSYQGAAYYSVTSALCSGVGITVALIPDAIYNVFASKVNGAVIEPLESSCGIISDDRIAEKLQRRRVNTVLCGCGLGLGENSLNTVRQVLSMDCPVVLDGDGLTAVCYDLSCLKRDFPTILTPHLGEFSRLVGVSIDDLKSKRVSVLREFSVKYNCITVLKDSVTLISDENGCLFRLSNPCSALSKGGSGDVLAGMMASFIAQGVSPVDSAVSAVTLHNACGHMCAEKLGVRYCQPEDFIQMISFFKV